jgi:hypothetical protein
MEINDILGAINAYYSTYGRYPAHKETRELLTDSTLDFTYGTRVGGSGWWTTRDDLKRWLSGLGLMIKTRRAMPK